MEQARGRRSHADADGHGVIVGARLASPYDPSHALRRPRSAAGGISKAIDRIEEIGGNAVQVFTQSPRMWRPTARTRDEIARFRKRRRQARVQARRVPRASTSSTSQAAIQAIRAKSFDALRGDDGDGADAIGAEAVVFHVGSHLGLGFDDAVALVVPALRELLELTTDDLWLCLENAAGAGGTIGRSIGELAAIVDALDGHERLGICLDSCHWWASGVDVPSPRRSTTRSAISTRASASTGCVSST